MKALTHDRYGTAEVLEYRDVAEPTLAADEVLVRVRAAAVNQGDSLAVEGIPYAARMTYGLTKPKQDVPGTDVAGRVEAVGREVTSLEPGDDVFGWATGAFAEYASTPARMVVRKPSNLTFEQAAAVPTAAVAALQGLRDVGQITAGQHVLIIGASGGVGSFAVQIAKTLEAEVTGVTSTRNVELVRSAGADHVIDYTRDDFTAHGPRYDLILDMVGREPLSSSRRALRRHGTYVVVGGQNARSLTGTERFVKALLLTPFVRQRLRPLFAQKSPDDLETLRALLAAGQVSPVIDAVYDLRDTAEALRHLQGGHAKGKVVLTV